MINQLKSIYLVITDKRNIALLFFLAIALSITWATIDQIEFNYRLDQEQRQLEQEVAVLEQKKRNKELQNQLLETDYFLELSAREKLGLVAEGENLLILQADKLTKRKEAIQEIYKDEAIKEVEAIEISNLEQWVRFFSGSSPQ